MAVEEDLPNLPANVAEEIPVRSGYTPPNPLSKSQLKKQAKLSKYAETKKARRRLEKEKQKQKRQEAKLKGLPINSGPSRKAIKKKLAATEDCNTALTVAIDLDFDDKMMDLDIAKCVKQCLRIYTINRRSEKPGQLHFTGLKQNGKIHQHFKKNHGWENWHVNYHFDKTHVDLFDREKTIYLTCESDVVLDTLSPENIYVIGGLVDHNHYKGLCHERAIKSGLKTARLPLSEHVDMKTRSVLSTYHVFELLVHVAQGKSWTEAILQTIPARKGAKPKESSENVSNVTNDIKQVDEKITH